MLMKNTVKVCMHQLMEVESIMKVSGLFLKGWKVKLNTPASEAVIVKENSGTDLVPHSVYSM